MRGMNTVSSNSSMPAQPSVVLQVSDLIEARTGLATHTQFNTELAMLLGTLAEGNIPAYIERLQNSRETAPIWQELLKGLTIGETYFLREQAHFTLLRKQILPELIAQRRTSGDLHLNIWSVGCASGEEAYSLAITLTEMLPDFDDWALHLVGTDLNEYALKLARRGVYRKWAFRHTDIDFQYRYFDPVADGLQIKSNIRRLVMFRHSNLLSGAPMPQFDVILCRNVLLYFSHKYASRAESIFYDALSLGGWLLLGQAESIRDRRDRWLTHLFPGAPVYQKPAKELHLKPGQFAFKQHEKLDNVRQPSPREIDITQSTALQAIHDEDYPLAESLLHRLIAAQPNRPQLHLLLAVVHANRNELTEAHAQLDTVLSLDPLMADAHYLQAMVFTEEGRSQEAEKSLRATLYCQRNHPLASFMLGNLFAQHGSLIQAQKHWTNAQHAVSALQPDSPITDISDMTAGRLKSLVEEQLNGWAG